MQITGKLHFPPYKTAFNYKTLVTKYKDILTETVSKVQALIMLNELRTTLYCPDHLKLGDEKFIKRIMGEQVTKKSSSGIVMGSFIKKSMWPTKRNNFSKSFRQGSAFQSKIEEGTVQSNNSSNKKAFEVPLVHQEVFPVYERIKKGDFSFGGTSSVFRNFQVSNIENAYLDLQDKEVSILVLNEVENQFYKPLGDDPKASVNLNKTASDHLMSLVTANDLIKKPSLAKSKIALVLRVYSMEGFKPQVINNINMKIKELLTLDSIRCFANVFVKATQIRFSPADIDYLSEIDRKMVRNLPLRGIYSTFE